MIGLPNGPQLLQNAPNPFNGMWTGTGSLARKLVVVR